MILDLYFKRPVFFDYLIGLITLFVLALLNYQNKLVMPGCQDSYSLTGDLTNIALTLAGFILTILTVLITFKDNSNSNLESSTVFNKFFQTDFYYETIKHLKNCIKSIILIAAIGFFLKLFLLNDYRKFLFYFNILGLIITILTVYRCLLILSKVLELQRNK